MNDTFAAGVEPGGLRTSQEIKILICYLLRTVEQPMLRDDVTDILVGNGMANYFDIEEAMEELLRLQHLVQSDDRRIATTVSGAQIGDELSVRIPYTLRERSVKAALRLLRRRSIEKDNTVTVDRSPARHLCRAGLRKNAVFRHAARGGRPPRRNGTRELPQRPYTAVPQCAGRADRRCRAAPRGQPDRDRPVT